MKILLAYLLGLATASATANAPLYVCIGPPCTSLTELTSAIVKRDAQDRPTTTLNGKVYTAPTFIYSIPNSVLIPDVVYVNGFDQ